ncbi:LacI family DNA-binding transcriptional regulator [Solirubrobacter sp. CPCC 204708]|uniref:LacI family transcriptional regulator n=1 Tax=Solirubrobacter deserti TaxID=2282478 RepID=A0ABT4RJH0_9ACTN|nr:LacI family DNA-binding transcriptional regulator [Solirubrobacter deserti]MBE2317699.1 LacI family DNA-binding transcriptional regulator [Solirubrobacter deserti]MDA0138650.1 LacI family transcriptional regulator [Solirubrobacter deserti]
MASLSDISRHAGVSIATCSRVLNGSAHPVSEATRRRVLKAAEELGYAPSALARALVTRSSRIIGVIVGDIVDPYFAEIARGVEAVGAELGYLTMVCSAELGSEAELGHLRQLRDYHAAGIVFAGSGRVDDPSAEALATAVEDARNRGSVVLALAQRDFEAPTILFDNEAAAHDITAHLRDRGHDRITFVEGPAGLHTSAQRRNGFLRAGGTDTIPGGFAYEDGCAAANQLLASGTLPDAIVAANDEVAIGVLTRLRDAGVKVPEDVSVAGIDDLRPAHFVGLTTVSVPLHEMGRRAAQAVLENGAQDVVLPHALAIRNTTR